jgi:hypothetical protein
MNLQVEVIRPIAVLSTRVEDNEFLGVTAAGGAKPSLVSAARQRPGNWIIPGMPDAPPS